MIMTYCISSHNCIHGEQGDPCWVFCVHIIWGNSPSSPSVIGLHLHTVHRHKHPLINFRESHLNSNISVCSSIALRLGWMGECQIPWYFKKGIQDLSGFVLEGGKHFFQLLILEQRQTCTVGGIISEDKLVHFLLTKKMECSSFAGSLQMKLQFPVLTSVILHVGSRSITTYYYESYYKYRYNYKFVRKKMSINGVGISTSWSC